MSREKKSSGYQNYLSLKCYRVNRLGEYIKSHLVPSLTENSNMCFNLEIGSGHGHWLTSYASIKPQETFVGLDLLTKRILKSQNKKLNLNLKNVHFIKADANEFISAIPENLKILNIFVMFPDPWPKKRHFKKRLIQKSFFQSLQNVCTTESQLFFRTDHKGYYDWTCELISSEKNWEHCPSEWPHESKSFFQDLFKVNYTCSAKHIH
jgi:tRNA (guanine-N7-)-methyltransferase